MPAARNVPTVDGRLALFSASNSDVADHSGDIVLGLHWAYDSSGRTYQRDIWRLSTSQVRWRNLLTRPMFSITCITGWAAEQQASASIFLISEAVLAPPKTRPPNCSPLCLNLIVFLFILTTPPTSLSHFRYVADSIYIYTLFQFPVHLLHRPESVREKDKEGSSRSSARSTATSL